MGLYTEKEVQEIRGYYRGMLKAEVKKQKLLLKKEQQDSSK